MKPPSQTLSGLASSKKALAASPKVGVIHAELKKDLIEGAWAVGERLPTEAELAARFECSQGTVNKAVALLVHEGFLSRGRRTGIHVLSNKARSMNSAGGAVGMNLELDAFAFIYPSERHEGIRRMARGFQDAAMESGRRLVTMPTGSDYSKEAELISRLAEFDVRGAVIVPLIPTFETQLHFSRTIMNPKIPVVIAGASLPGIGCSAVQLDNFLAGYTMTKRHIERGVRTVGFFTNRVWAGYVRDRYQGYRLAMREAGLEERSEWVMLHEGMNINFEGPLEEPTQLARQYLNSAFGSAPSSAVVRSSKKKTASDVCAVVCADDFLATGMVIAARERGLRIPDDLLITGMDDYQSLPQPEGISLTTYHIPYEEIGRESFRLLQDQVNGAPRKVGETLLPGQVVERSSG